LLLGPSEPYPLQLGPLARAPIAALTRNVIRDGSRAQKLPTLFEQHEIGAFRAPIAVARCCGDFGAVIVSARASLSSRALQALRVRPAEPSEFQDCAADRA
jgi:hypothetical protein